MNKKQVILITGTRKGLGKHLVEYYAKQGLQVIGCSRGPVDYKCKNYRHFCLDVADEVAVKKMFAEIRKTYARLDVLINNAGIAIMNHALLTPLETVEKTLKTNFIGVFLFCREAAKLMQKNSYGRIVNISTIAVPLSPAGTSVYSASKAAVEQFSRVLAREIVSYGITVNTLALSFVKDSGMVENISKDAIKETLEHTISKSLLDFKDVAHAIDFFISPKSNMVVGQILYLGGV